MSRAVQQLATEGGHRVQAVITGAENRDGRAITRERLGEVDVVIEFTRPEAAPALLQRLAALRLPTVSGTTGWQDRLPEVIRTVTAHGAALLHSPNFAVGVQLFLRVARDLARRFAARPGFEALVLEAHHGAKRDAPSGTALRLVELLRAGDGGRAFPVTSLRGGYLPGTHEVVYDAPFETIRLEHVARSRLVFAAGALQAAEWLPGRAGVFTFDQMLFGEEP
jgi:4-hydroxy-tetrahydrodipicolinate reductase